jgi:putative component of toxin-antitoxin plasmid stabilization module
MLVRIFCHAHGNKLILLLGGYDKAKDPSRKRQQAEIETARRRLTDWRRRQRSSSP